MKHELLTTMSLCLACSPVSGMAQTVPGAVPFSADSAFVEASGMRANPMGTVEIRSWKTDATLETVTQSLEASIEGTFAISTEAHPDKEMRDLIDRPAGDTLMTTLAAATNSGLTGPEFHAAFTKGFAADRPAEARQAIGVRMAADGSMTRVEVQNPFFDVGTFAWVSATRIREVKLRMDGAGGS